MTTDTSRHWWGEFRLAEGRWAHFEIGPLSLYARRVPGEWRFAWLGIGDSLSERLNIVLETTNEPDFEDRTLGRFAMRDPGDRLLITPRLAERAVVVRPEIPMYVPAHEQTTLYISTPVWLALSAAGGSTGFLTEIPSSLPSETWFGRNTLEGESCYAIKTKARTDLSQLANVPHRAVTPVEIRNDGEDSLNVERLRVPVYNLALYVTPDGRIWTDKVRFDRETGESSAALQISADTGSGSEGRSKIAGPRERRGKNLMEEAFSRFFG